VGFYNRMPVAKKNAAHPQDVALIDQPSKSVITAMDGRLTHFAHIIPIFNMHES
jgi:hypothetical protein